MKNYLKKAVAWPASWACFWIGHFCSLFLNKWPDTREDWDEKAEDRIDWVYYYVGFWYRGYQSFMNWSCLIQDWAELSLDEQSPWYKRGPWHKPESLNGEAEDGLED